MPVEVGERLGPYEILERIGAGGMGEVYKARDTRLDRIVAIKVSQERFSERFEREARAVAAINHPNICQLHDTVGNYLIMEYVDGSPIAPPDSLRKLLDLAVQVADGLAAAHALRIVHRDLKPDNILVTREGRVKILDFGLAKLAAADDFGSDVTFARATDPGTTYGTVNYMSPEQARGEPNLTPQSDQFSFGLVLYELIAGLGAFRRGSAAETMTAIIREEAEPLPASAPTPLRWIVERLLAKEPAERYESTRDLYRELKQIRDRLSESISATQSVAPEAASKRARRLLLPLTAVACFVAGGAAALFSLPLTDNGPDLAQYKFTPISQAEAEERAPRWSPNGTSVAYTTRIRGIHQVFTRVLGSNAVQLTKAVLDCSAPFWSPDGSTIYYVSDKKLWATPASGGGPHMVLEGVDSAAIHPDGKTLAFERDRGVWNRIAYQQRCQGTLVGTRQRRVELFARRFEAGGQQHRADVGLHVSIRPSQTIRGRRAGDAGQLVSGQPPRGRVCAEPLQRSERSAVDCRRDGWHAAHHRLRPGRVLFPFGVAGWNADRLLER